MGTICPSFALNSIEGLGFYETFVLVGAVVGFYDHVAKGGAARPAVADGSELSHQGMTQFCAIACERTKPMMLVWFCEYPKDTHKSVTVFKTVAKLQPDNFGSQAEPPGQ